MRTLALLLCLSGIAQAYTVVSTSTDATITSPLVKTDTLIQDGSDARNRFIMHRVHRSSGTPYKGTVFLPPSLLTSFAEYMIDGGGNPMQSLAATLALAGYDIWGYSPRTATLGYHACSSGAVDCSIIDTWGFATYLADIEYMRAQIEAAHPGEKPVIGGLSLGGMLAMASVNAHPNDYAGVIIWESMLYSVNPVITVLNTANCAAWDAQLLLGVTYNELLQDSSLLAIVTPITAALFFGAPIPLLGTPTFTLDVANLLHTAPAYANFARLQAMVNADHSVESIRILRDYECSLAGDRTYTNNLGSFTAPLLAIGGGQALGAYMGDNIALFGSSSKSVHVTAQHGHADAYLSANHATYVDNVILDWLDNVVVF